MTQQQQQHYYIARKSCGCVCRTTNDTSFESKKEAAWVASVVAESIRKGLTVQRVSREELLELSNEETYHNCPHGINGQLVMELENHNGQTG